MKSMLQSREVIHDPFKIWKSLSLSTIKARKHLNFAMRLALALSILASISLVTYIAFWNQSRLPRYPSYAGDCKYSAARRITQKEHFAGDGDRERTNISHIVFGIGGSAKTWHKRRHYCEVWWKPNVTRGCVWLDKRPPAEEPWPVTSPPYRISGDTANFKYTSWYGSRSAVRIARILKETFELGFENARWFVMGDDDTVFFTENLVSVLAKYDHNQMYYIGGNSESVEQDVVHSYGMAYGGGGFAVSYPLAAELVNILDGCIDRYASFYGSDQKVQACVDEIGVPLTKELGFHQFDIQGDPYGILATHPMTPLVSLHHLDYVRPLFWGSNRVESLKKLVKTYELDPGRILQRSFCYDFNRNWTIYVAWGYTVQLYPSLITAKMLETPLQTFLTWKGNMKPFTFNTRSLSPDSCKRPLLYFFDEVERDEIGQVVTTYNRFGGGLLRDCFRDDYREALDIDSFSISAPKLEPDFWKKAPRRQCCEIVDGGDDADSVVQVKIRGCRRRESLTPP